MTAAHTVRGATTVTVGGQPAAVLFIDHRADIAVLGVVADNRQNKSGTGGAVRFATPVRGPATMLRGRHNELPVARVALVVINHAPINIEEPIDSTTYRRDGLVTKLDSGSVTAGDSGAPIINASGAVIGMVFATDTATGTTAYAVSSFELQGSLSRAGTKAVSTGAC